MKIAKIHSRQILDSRGNPTVETDVILENGILGRAAVPSGASTGSNEAIELRDGDPKLYSGKSVLNAVKNVNGEINKAMAGKNVLDQEKIDREMISLDGTENKGRLGANAILSVSMATAKAAAMAENLELFEYFRLISGDKGENYELPMPMMNIINGGKHAAGSTDIQEFMIMPVGAKNVSEAIRMGAEIFHALGKVLSEKGYSTTVGDEGGYAPHVKEGNQEALELISTAIEKANYKLGEDVGLALDVAATELFQDGKYHLKKEGKTLSSDEMTDWYEKLSEKYPILSIEDGLSEDDWKGWGKLTERLGSKLQLVGDDLFVTNKRFLERGIKEKSANAILIKLNQIGTVSETIDSIKLANDNNWNSIVSHRSGETEDTTIADFVVGLNTGQIKTGSLSRTDRTAKYNQLMRIEEKLGIKAKFNKNFKF